MAALTFATEVVVFLVILSCAVAKISQDQIKDFEAMGMKNILKDEMKKAQKLQRRQGPQLFDQTFTTKPAENYSHPFHKPGIIQEIQYSYRRYREMILLRGAKFWMGTNDPSSTTGEYPLRQVAVKSFYLDANPVINADYWAFRAKKKFVRSEAERKGWSWVVDMFVSEETRNYYSMQGSTGWAAVKKAHWDAPEGPDSNLIDRWKHPVIHLSWYDAKQYCEFHGKRLPTEPEWEYAARAGAAGYAYPWGDNWERRRANVWQGRWPNENKAADGYNMTSPVDAYLPQNLIGFYDMIGNVWEWTTSAYVERMVQPHLQSSMVVLKGGSYTDSVNGKVNYPVRNGQRIGHRQDYTAGNVGFRCAKSAPEADKKMAEAKAALQEPKKRKGRVFHRKKKDEL